MLRPSLCSWSGTFQTCNAGRPTGAGSELRSWTVMWADQAHAALNGLRRLNLCCRLRRSPVPRIRLAGVRPQHHRFQAQLAPVMVQTATSRCGHWLRNRRDRLLPVRCQALGRLCH